MQKATIDQPAYNQHGALLIKTSINAQGVISLYVTAGAGRIDTLSKAFTDRDQAAAWYRHIATAAEQGKPIYAIEWEVAALTEAGTAVDVEQIAEAINADWDARDNQRKAAADKLAADVAEIMAPTRRVRNTRSHVYRQSLNDRQTAAVRGHRNGIVRLGDGVTRPMLAAIADKGYGRLVMVPGTRYTIDHLVLNERGHAITAS
jgi:hypothetical protein